MRPDWFFFAVLYVVLAGCVNPPDSVRQDGQISARRPMHAFEARGVLAIRTPKETSSLHWQWHQQDAQYVLVLRGPTGIGTATLRGQPGQVTLTTSDGKSRRASRPEQLLFQATGWHLPLSGWRYWIRGLPDPALPATKHYDAAHRLSVLQQNGWTLHYLHYRTASGIALPDQILLTNASLSLKVVVREWSYH